MSWLGKNNPWLLIATGTLLWSLTMVKSGLVYDYGMGFWGPNGHDGIWHVALINSISKGSFQLPIFSGARIQNYHLGFDILLAAIHFLTRIPAVNLYFQITPPILAFLIGLLTFKLTQSRWSVFFVYFGGSLGWVFGRGESTFWSQQAISTLVNPPFALSLVLLLVLLLLLKNERYFWAALIAATLPHVKIYAGLLAFFGLFVAGFKNRKLYKTLIIGLLIYLLTSYKLIANGSQLLVWSPGWFLETLFSPDHLDWPRFYSALNTYRVSTNWLKAAPAFSAALLVFLLGNFSTRLVFFFNSKKDLLHYFSWPVILAGIIVPMLFLQKGTAWNTIQFFYYSLFFSSLLAGVALSKILKINKLNNYLPARRKRWLEIGIWLLVISLTLPTTWDTLSRVYLPGRPPAMVSTGELKALDFLSRQPPGTVLTYPATPDSYASPPRPLFKYDSTAYVSALSGQNTFMEDEVNLGIIGIPWQTRRSQILSFFQSPDRQFLTQNNIKYIYLPSQGLSIPNLPANRIFSNSQAFVFSVD